MQATARSSSVVKSTSTARRRLMWGVSLIDHLRGLTKMVFGRNHFVGVNDMVDQRAFDHAPFVVAYHFPASFVSAKKETVPALRGIFDHQRNGLDWIVLRVPPDRMDTDRTQRVESRIMLRLSLRRITEPTENIGANGRTNRGRINRLDALSLDGFRRLGVLRFVHKFFVPVSAVPALDVSNINPSASLHRATRGIQR